MTVDLARLRADRPVRHAGRRRRPRSPREIARGLDRGLGRPDEPPATASVERAAGIFAARASPAGRSPGRLDGGSLTRMAAGLFELRKDAITGWWVATIVDRTFHRDRFARSPRRRSTTAATARTAGSPPATASASGPSRTSRSTSSAPRRRLASSTGRSPRSRIAKARAAGSWRTVVAPPRRAPAAPRRRQRDRSSELLRALPGRDRRRADGRPDRLPPGRPELGRPGRRPDEPPVPRPLRPAPDPAPDRRGARRRRPVRHPRGRVPVLPARPRRARRPGAARLGGRRHRRLRAVRLALAVRGLDRPAPSRGGLRRRDRRGPRGHRRGAPPGPRPAGRGLDGPPYNLVLHTAPLREQVDATYHWHWEIHPRLREIAGLELGTGLPVNPVSPEDAVEELLRTRRRPTIGGPG